MGYGGVKQGAGRGVTRPNRLRPSRVCSLLMQAYLCRSGDGATWDPHVRSSGSPLGQTPGHVVRGRGWDWPVWKLLTNQGDLSGMASSRLL